MTKQEAIDIVNKRNASRPTGWAYADAKKFGWGLKPKNRRYKTSVPAWYKERRKRERTFIRSIKHKVLFHIPITEEELKQLPSYDMNLYLSILGITWEEYWQTL